MNQRKDTAPAPANTQQSINLLRLGPMGLLKIGGLAVTTGLGVFGAGHAAYSAGEAFGPGFADAASAAPGLVVAGTEGIGAGVYDWATEKPPQEVSDLTPAQQRAIIVTEQGQ